MPDYKKGVENIPSLVQRGPFPIKVFVINIHNSDEEVQVLDMDFSKPEHRQQIGRLTWWAINNGHSIETMALKDAEQAI